MSSFIRTILIPLALITILCVAVVEALYYYGEKHLLTVNEESVEPSEVSRTGEKIVKDFKKPIDYSIITKRNLFASRETVEPPVTEKKVQAELEMSSMDVVLMGTVSGVGDGQRAIIYDKKDKKQELFQVGDYIEQAIIKQILRGKVILTLNGKDEMLDISEARNVPVPRVAKASPVVQTRKVAGRPAGQTNQQARQPAAATQAGVDPESSSTPVKRPKQLRSFRGGVIVRDKTNNSQQ